MTVVNAQNIQDAQDAKRVNPAAHFVGGTVTAQGFELKDKPWIDVSKCPEMRHLELKEDGLHLGAALSLRELEASPALAQQYPLLTEALQHVANPQTRAQATVGGALCQELRCPYYKHAAYKCLQKGGTECFATGEEGFPFAIINNQTCAGLNASTLGTTLLALGARLSIDNPLMAPQSNRDITMSQFYKVKKDMPQTHQLDANDLITQILLPKESAGNLQKYVRLAARSQADWAEIEIALNAQISADRIEWVRVVVGAVALQPVRLLGLEKTLQGRLPGDIISPKAWAHNLPTFTPLAGQDYRIAMLKNTLQAMFEEAFS